MAICFGGGPLAWAQSPLPPQTPPQPGRAGAIEGDWLLDASQATARVVDTGDELTLSNGLVRRVFRLKPGGATVAIDNLMTGQAMLRAVDREAMVKLDGKEFAVGGLVGQPNRAFSLPEWVAAMKPAAGSFQLISHRIVKPTATLNWKRKRHAADMAWPLPGNAVEFTYRGPTEATQGITVTVHYEMYDGLPVIAKWLTVTNAGAKAVRLDRFEVERLALVEAESAVDERTEGQWRKPGVEVLSDYMFKGMDAVTSNRVATWEIDPAYGTQVNFVGRTPCVLAVAPPLGPGMDIPAGETWSSFRSYAVFFDSTERERMGLTMRRAIKGLAPWTTENPLMMHVRSGDRKTFRTAVDQCAEVGFEMIIYTFGSGLNMESDDPAYLAKIKEDVDYAHSKGLEVGGYSLFSSRHIDAASDVINPATGKPGGAIFGNAPCYGSKWGQDYVRKIKNFIEKTGFDLLEHDGPYPGDVCASKEHPGHRGLEDSQWVNWRTSVDLYRWCQERGVYVNQPDFYFLAGGNKTGMGYRETNWSLPRAQQLIHSRQHIFDGTWTKPQTAGWMFVPLTEYQGGGPAATLEPLKDNLADYEGHLACALGAGVQACYRGPRLYDSDETKAVVKKWVAWFKQYRAILESDLLHVRRADGRDVDYVMQVNPTLKTRAIAVVHNPLNETVERSIQLPLYYAGLKQRAMVREQDGKLKAITLDEKQRGNVPVRIGPRGRTWLVVEGE